MPDHSPSSATAPPYPYPAALALSAVAWAWALFTSLVAVFVSPPLPSATRRAQVFMVVVRAFGAIVPNAQLGRALFAPLSLLGGAMKRLRLLDGVVYREVELRVAPRRHEADLRPFGIDYAPAGALPNGDAPTRVLHAEWVTTRAAWPEIPHDTPVALFLHGGAFFSLDTRAYRAVTRRLARLGFAVLAVDYRLAPEHAFPCALVDALAAFRWLVNDANIDPRRIVLVGDSAGGNLCVALHALLRAMHEPALPAGLCLISPALDVASAFQPSATANEHFDFLSVMTNRKLSVARTYLGRAAPRQRWWSIGADEKAVTAAESAVHAHLFINVTKTTHGATPILIQSSPTEQLASCIEAFFAHQPSATARVQHDLAVDTPHVPHVVGAWIPLVRRRNPATTPDIVDTLYARIWDWWTRVAADQIQPGKVKYVIRGDTGKVQEVEVRSAPPTPAKKAAAAAPKQANGSGGEIKQRKAATSAKMAPIKPPPGGNAASANGGSGGGSGAKSPIESAAATAAV
ncbi:hypothetical protein H9P43_000666 [Blastocladiella emersonii ATCC 22665]|nr:hypothetical protein H9P43_000666 [Blastocladiella emersonii ATCC 22665]